MLARALRRQRACAAQPVQERGGGHQRGRFAGNRAAELVDLGEDLGGRQPRRRADPAGHHHPAAEPAAAQPADQPQHPFLMQGEPGGGHREPGRVGQPDRDVEVVGDPLELGVQHPDQGRGRRRLTTRDCLDRVAEGQGVGDRGDALGALGQQHAVRRGHPGEPVLHAAVLVEHPHVQVRDRLARGLDQVLDRFHHAGADRAVRDREDPVARDVPGQRVVFRRAGPDERRQPRVPLRDHAEAVVDLALVPERGAEPRGERGIAGRARRQRRLERVDAPARLPFPLHCDVRGQDQRAALGFGGEQAGEPVPGVDPGLEFFPQRGDGRLSDRHRAAPSWATAR